MVSITRKQIRRSALYTIIVLEKIFPHRFRHSLYKLEGMFALAFAVMALILYGAVNGISVSPVSIDMNPDTLAFIDSLLPKAVGLLLTLISFWSVAFMAEVFFRSYYLKDRKKRKFDFETVWVIYNAKDGDLAKSLISSYVGEEVLLRCGIPKKIMIDYLRNRGTYNTSRFLDEHPSKPQTLKELVSFILETDKGFKEFLFSIGIKEKDFIGAAGWVGRMKEKERYREKWWSRERLGKISPLGEDWAYGQTYILDRYSTPILFRKATPLSGDKKSDEVVGQLVTILSKDREANAVIVGRDGVGKLDIVYRFAREITGEVAPKSLKHKRVVVLDTDLVVATSKSKQEFDSNIIQIFNQAIAAGNIILVIDNLPGFILGGRAIGSDVVGLIDPYLTSPSMQVIATSDTDTFHRYIEQNSALMRRFEKILIEEPEMDNVVYVLEDVAVALEKRNNVIFTYPAIVEAVNAAENYFPDGVMPDKAIDILVEIAPIMEQKRKIIVEKKDVWDLVRLKTHIPVGEMDEGEREKLANLEKILHERVVGQDEAIKLISSAMRRARTGIRNLKRPIGSFLFIGPTGVGKTETAKSLAYVFFGDEDAMSRIDMSEYQTPDALERLIGSFEDGKVGVLASLLREKPYGVLLLDEFEKTNPDVHDLFLQILDEGFFSDMRGRRVNARNIIFIATSNAGSQFIWGAVEKGIDITEVKDELIEKIIKKGRFKPELLNRFDGVVLFHPLTMEHLKKIARLMLEKLKKRLRERGIDFVITDGAIEYVAKEGYDPTFGARPMVRVIQNEIEQKIAEKLISGELYEGASIRFEDLRLLSPPPVPPKPPKV